MSQILRRVKTSVCMFASDLGFEPYAMISTKCSLNSTIYTWPSVTLSPKHHILSGFYCMSLKKNMWEGYHAHIVRITEYKFCLHRAINPNQPACPKLDNLQLI